MVSIKISRGKFPRPGPDTSALRMLERLTAVNHNGHLSTTVTSLYRSPLHNGHLSITVTSPQRPPLYNGHLSTTVTSL